MKDQNNIEDNESKQDKWNRGLDIFIESVIKPDPALRQCAHNQRCYHEQGQGEPGAVQLWDSHQEGRAGVRGGGEVRGLTINLVYTSPRSRSPRPRWGAQSSAPTR